MFKNIYNERLDKIEKLSKKIKNDGLKFIVQTSGDEVDFTKADDPMVFLNNIKTGKIKLEEAKNLQEDFNERKGIRKEKNTEQKKVLLNINMLFNGRNDAIKFVDYYGSMILEAKRKEKYGEGLKILTPEQMFQRLSIALAQVKPGNNS